MQTLTAVLVGAGARGAHSYAPYALDYPHELKFVAIVEPDGHRRDQFAQPYDGICRRSIETEQWSVDRHQRFCQIFYFTMTREHF